MSTERIRLARLQVLVPSTVFVEPASQDPGRWPACRLEGP